MSSVLRPRPSLESWLCVITAIVTLSAAAPARAAEESLTITVSSYVRTTPSNPAGHFKGFGLNATPGLEFEAAPHALQRKCTQLFWGDLDLRVVRLWGAPGQGMDSNYTADIIYGQTHVFMESIRKIQPNPLILIYDPHTTWRSEDIDNCWSSRVDEAKLRAYIVKHADTVRDLDRDYGWRVQYVEITNEPECYLPEGGWSNQALWTKALLMTRLWREELDARGFADVKVLAASRSNVDADALKLCDAFKADADLLRSWGGFSFHSYGMGLNRAVADRLEGLDVEIVQTESGSAGLVGISHVISDLNLGATIWLWFQGYSWDPNSPGIEPPTDGIRLAGYTNGATADSMEVVPYPKFYFFREVVKLIPVGSRVHRCTSSKANTAQWKNMEFVDGQQPPVAATGAVRPDGTWGLVAFNASAPSAPYSIPYPATTLNVTFTVPELAAAGPQSFAVRKIMPDGREVDLPEQTMVAGQITVAALLPSEMVSLRSISP